jgi:hypothetical protein
MRRGRRRRVSQEATEPETRSVLSRTKKRMGESSGVTKRVSVRGFSGSLLVQ